MGIAVSVIQSWYPVEEGYDCIIIFICRAIAAHYLQHLTSLVGRNTKHHLHQMIAEPA